MAEGRGVGACESVDVVVLGAGPAGLTLGNVLIGAGIDCVVLERTSRRQVQTRARAGFLAANTVRILDRHGLSDGLRRRGHEHSRCEFRTEDGRFALDCAHSGSLATLLRYLTMLGAVTQDKAGFRLTPVGALLREDEPHSMRALALMYGGSFYQSFAQLGYAVRTGREAFAHLFGVNHFEYFGRRPELADLFDRSMAASARTFDPVPTHPAFAPTATGVSATVVDVAGGNGDLLGRILAAHPHLRGVLLERPHAVEAARATMAAAGCGSRCTYRAGDFADVPPGGDVYILSRVLHDWDDERCREILRHCAAAMPADADLLILERVLPTDGSPSLATAWDLHMMCNVGGRERSAGHYARLLADTGFELIDCAPLPLDGNLLHARRTRMVG